MAIFQVHNELASCPRYS